MIIKKIIGTYSLKASKLQICEWSNLHTKYPQKKKEPCKWYQETACKHSCIFYMHATYIKMNDEKTLFPVLNNYYKLFSFKAKTPCYKNLSKFKALAEQEFYMI